MRTSMIAVACLGLAACASTPRDTTGTAMSSAHPAAAAASSMDSATVMLNAASGSLVSGTLTARPMGDGLHVTGEVGGLAPNSTHGFHIHAKGDCSAADASSAGDHFNPTTQPHGRSGSAHYHGGDADNLVADAKGVAEVDWHFPGLTLGGGGANDALGKAIIVHANRDDYTTQPSGDAGARIACGVIK